jgi:hypothetical protein
VDSNSEDEEQFGVRGESIEWEVELGIGQLAREEVIDWILDVRKLYPPILSCCSIVCLFVIGHASPPKR